MGTACTETGRLAGKTPAARTCKARGNTISTDGHKGPKRLCSKAGLTKLHSRSRNPDEVRKRAGCRQILYRPLIRRLPAASPTCKAGKTTAGGAVENPQEAPEGALCHPCTWPGTLTLMLKSRTPRLQDIVADTSSSNCSTEK